MPPKRRKQNAKEGSQSKNARADIERNKKSKMSAQDIQEVTLSVIQTLKEQGLVSLPNSDLKDVGASSYPANMDNQSGMETFSRQGDDSEIGFRPVDVASGVLQDLTGESHSVYSEASPVVSSCNFKEKSITRSIPGLIRDKIINNEFVDLSILLPRHRHKTAGGNDRDNQKKFQIRRIEDWTNAFLVYSAIFATKYPEAGSGLFAYMANIRFLASSVDSLSWLHYNIDFSQARESEPISWAAIDNDLWLKAMANPRPFRTGGSQASYQQGDLGSLEGRNSGDCWAKGKYGSCTKRYCNFRHTCTKCQREHRGANCGSSQSSNPKSSSESSNIANANKI